MFFHQPIYIFASRIKIIHGYEQNRDSCFETRFRNNLCSILWSKTLNGFLNLLIHGEFTSKLIRWIYETTRIFGRILWGRFCGITHRWIYGVVPGLNCNCWRIGSENDWCFLKSLHESFNLWIKLCWFSWKNFCRNMFKVSQSNS